MVQRLPDIPITEECFAGRPSLIRQGTVLGRVSSLEQCYV